MDRTCFDNILCHVNKDGHCLCGEEHCPLHRCVVTGTASEAPILGKLNRRLHLVAVEAGFFATAVLGLYDPDTGAMSITRAGHPAPLVFRRNGDVKAIGKPRPALGLLPKVDYIETRLQLEPGDTILFFTDGAIEVCDAEERELGVEGLQGLALDQATADPENTFHLDPLEEQLLTFSKELQLPDDLTLFKLRRTP